MSMGMHTDTAKVIAFPKRAPAAEKFSRQSANVLDLSSRRPPVAAIGDGWYHDAAISEDRGDRR